MGDDELWRLEIIKDDEVLFQGLLARHAGGSKAGQQVRFWLIDSTGLTLMKLVSHGGELAVVMALPPFDETYVSDYIRQNLEISICCNEPDACISRGLCGVNESECKHRAGNYRCLEGRFGFFNAWELICGFSRNIQTGTSGKVEEMIIKERYPRMEMRFKRLG